MQSMQVTVIVSVSSEIATNMTTSPSMTQQPDYSNCTSDTRANNCEVSKNAVGIVVGLLMLLLAVVVTGWGWTCWILKRGVKRNATPHSQRRYIYICDSACSFLGFQIQTQLGIAIMLEQNFPWIME